MKARLFVLVVVIFVTCCRTQNKNDVANGKLSSDTTLALETPALSTSETVDRDTLLWMIFRRAESYFKKNTLDAIVSINGKPRYISKTQLGDNTEDSLLTVRYEFQRFRFWIIGQSKPALEGVDLFDKQVLLPGNLLVGKTTRNDILQILGLPDQDHNDPGRTMTRSGDTTVYGTSSGRGDTVTFTYFINTYDDFGIGFAMTKDTLREISWSRNMY